MEQITRRKEHVQHLFLLVIIILAAAFFRLHHLDSLPPALYHDEAFNGLDAQRLLQNGRLPIFFPNNSGREPLHIYLQAVSLYLLGNSAWSLRFVSAIMGILTIPLVYRLAQSLFRNLGRRAYHIGILAAASLAFSYWHISFSRIAFRTAYLLPFLIATIWLFWRGWQQKSYRSFVGSGIALGVSLYTYLPARLLPLLLVFLVLSRLPAVWRQAKGQWRVVGQLPFIRGSVLTAVVSLVLFLPLGIYFIQYPELFMARSSYLSIFNTNSADPGQSWELLGKNAAAVFRMFIDQGDMKLRHNLPGRPAINALETVGLLVGVGLAIKNIRHPRYYLLLFWFGLMLLPTILSGEAPHSLRAIGALPAVVVLIALGLDRLQLYLVSKSRVTQAHAFAALLLLLGVFSGMSTYRDYFRLWANNPDMAIQFDIQEYALAQQTINRLTTQDVAVPFALQNHPTFLFVTQSVNIAWVPVESWRMQRPVTIFKRVGQPLNELNLLHLNDNNIVFSTIPPLTSQQLAQLLNNAAQTIYLENTEIGQEISLPPTLLPQTAVPANTTQHNWANKISLTGYSLLPTTVLPGESVTLSLFWQSQAALPLDYSSFAHLSTATYNVIAKQHQPPLGNIYPSTQWQPGDLIIDTYHFTIPSDAQPGKYQFDIGLFDLVSGDRLSVLNSNQELVGDYLLVGAVTVTDPIGSTAPPQWPADAVFGQEEQIQLQGYDLAETSLAPGSVLDFTLHWQAKTTVLRDYTVFIHFINAAGEIVAQQDTMPGDGQYRSSLWFVEEVIRDQRQLALPAELPPGQYQIGLGLYYWPTGERLPASTLEGTEIPDGRIILPTTLTISE